MKADEATMVAATRETSSVGTVDPSSVTTVKCPTCGSLLLPDAPAGLCAKCLLRGALAGGAADGAATLADGAEGDRPRVEDGPPLLTRFGDYEIVERIASGGMGVVYKARQISVNRVVALKMILGGRLATETEIARFHAEAAAAANLDHPHIVPIYDVGEYEGRQYFTMKFIDGTNLAARMTEFRKDPIAAAKLIGTCARAVHHGHRRGVLHRDLKPGNLLLDAEATPYVSDFGVAKREDAPGTVNHQTHTGTILGTPAYMAPEQASGRGKDMTTAADVYSLGAILYEMLTGRPPFEGENVHETLRLVREVPPVRPRQVDPSIDVDLETICLKCLEKDRNCRYGSAEDLAHELSRFISGEPIVARPVGRAVRVWRWAKRFPLTAGFAATVLLSLAFMIFAAVFVARSLREARVTEVAKGNAYAAQWLAGTVLYQLRDYCDAVERTARDDQAPLRGIALNTSDHTGAEAYLGKLFDRLNSPALGLHRTPGRKLAFDSVFIVGPTGFAAGRWPTPVPGDYYATDFAHRDYFRGAREYVEQGRTVAYVSRAFQSKADRMYKLGITRPILGEHGEFLGALVVTVATDPSFGMLNFHGQSRSAVLVAQMEPGAASATTVPASPQHIVLLHDNLSHGQYVPVEHPRLREFAPDPARPQLQLDDPGPPVFADDYVDPVAELSSYRHFSKYAGHWLAGFAPVGNTHLTVVVQTRYEEAVALDRMLIGRLAGWAGVAVVLGATALLVILFIARTRQRRLAAI